MAELVTEKVIDSLAGYTLPADPDRPKLLMERATVADIVLRHQGKTIRLRALIDSGAGGTMLPRSSLESIDAPYQDQFIMQGVTGDREIVDCYLTTVMIGPYVSYGIQAVAIGDHEDAIIGRDVLNNLVVVLDRLAQEVENSQQR